MPATSVAVSPVMPDVPPMFNVPVALFVSVDAPESAVATVNVPALDVVPLMVTVGIEIVPVIVFAVPSKIFPPIVLGVCKAVAVPAFLLLKFDLLY